MFFIRICIYERKSLNLSKLYISSNYLDMNYTLNHTENKMVSFDSFNYFTRNFEMDVNFSVENSLKKEESSLKKDSFNNLSILSSESVRILSL